VILEALFDWRVQKGRYRTLEYYQASYPSSRTSWWCQAYLRSNVRRNFVENVIRDSVTYTEDAGRKTV
jgi:hypothetical protein